MKIAWFTPFSAKSAIGKYSMFATNELAKYCQVDLWLFETEDLLPTELRTFFYTPGDDLSQKLSGYDHIIYNMGDCLDFHLGVYETLTRTKGIVILHDLILHHFFVGYHCLVKNDTAGYVRDMGSLYGEQGRAIALDSINNKCTPIFETDGVMDYPYFEKVIRGAKGIIVHSAFHASKVEAIYPGPVGVIGHPFVSGSKAEDARKADRARLGLPEDKIILITIGYVNPNKRVDKIIEAMAGDRALADKVTYLIIGPYEEKAEYIKGLKSKLKQLGLENTVKMLGYQSDEVLSAYMSCADIFLNLRNPVMEGASWSVIEEMYHGKPVIVTDASHYSEIPDGCVVKVAPDNEMEGIRAALTRLVFDEKLRIEVGSNGCRYAMGTFSPEKYCADLLKFLNSVNSYRLLMSKLETVGRELGVMSVTEDMPVVNIVSCEIYTMFAPNGGKPSG